MEGEDCIKILSPSTESELRKLLTDNFVCGLGCCFMSVVGIFAALGLCSLGVLSDQSKFTDMIVFICMAWMLPFIFVFFFTLFVIIIRHEFGGDIVGGWCRNKVFAALLMINVFNLISSENRCRTLKLMHRINEEFEDPELALIEL